MLTAMEQFSPEEDRTHDAASSRTASPTHYQRAIPAPDGTLQNKQCSFRPTPLLSSGLPWADCGESRRSAHGPFRAVRCHLKEKWKQLLLSLWTRCRTPDLRYSYWSCHCGSFHCRQNDVLYSPNVTNGGVPPNANSRCWQTLTLRSETGVEECWRPHVRARTLCVCVCVCV